MRSPWGMPLVACPGILGAVSRWDNIEVEWDETRVINHTTGQALRSEALSLADRQMLEAGGLVPYLKSAHSQKETRL